MMLMNVSIGPGTRETTAIVFYFSFTDLLDKGNIAIPETKLTLFDNSMRNYIVNNGVLI